MLFNQENWSHVAGVFHNSCIKNNWFSDCARSNIMLSCIKICARKWNEQTESKKRKKKCEHSTDREMNLLSAWKHNAVVDTIAPTATNWSRFIFFSYLIFLLLLFELIFAVHFYFWVIWILKLNLLCVQWFFFCLFILKTLFGSSERCVYESFMVCAPAFMKIIPGKKRVHHWNNSGTTVSDDTFIWINVATL